MAVYDNPNTYEQQNDESLNRLFNKVRSLVRILVFLTGRGRSL